MKNGMAVILVGMVSFGFVMPAFAGENWTDLNRQVIDLHTKGDYIRAVATAEKALKAAEKQFGQDAPEVSLALNNLALSLKYEGRYTEAAGFYERALEIAEKVKGPEHPDLTVFLNNLAFLYKAQGNQEKVNEIYGRLRKISDASTMLPSRTIAKAFYGKILSIDYEAGVIRMSRTRAVGDEAKEASVQTGSGTRFVGVKDIGDLTVGDRIVADVFFDTDMDVWTGKVVTLNEPVSGHTQTWQ